MAMALPLPLVLALQPFVLLPMLRHMHALGQLHTCLARLRLWKRGSALLLLLPALTMRSTLLRVKVLRTAHPRTRMHMRLQMHTRMYTQVLLQERVLDRLTHTQQAWAQQPLPLPLPLHLLRLRTLPLHTRMVLWHPAQAQVLVLVLVLGRRQLRQLRPHQRQPRQQSAAAVQVAAVLVAEAPSHIPWATHWLPRRLISRPRSLLPRAPSAQA